MFLTMPCLKKQLQLILGKPEQRNTSISGRYRSTHSLNTGRHTSIGEEADQNQMSPLFLQQERARGSSVNASAVDLTQVAAAHSR